MPVQIHINGENADEALRELSSLASGLSPQQGAAAPADAPKSNSRSRTTAKAADPMKEPEAELKEDAKPEQDEPGESEQDGDGAPIPTDVELRAKAQEVGTTPEKKKSIKALLDKYGSKNITEMPENKRAAFMQDLEALATPEEL